MKNVLIILVHPNLTQSQVNKTLANGVADLPNVKVRSLYDLYPDGKINVATEQAELEQADRIVLQFPMYWYSSPALLKQWLDDVLTYGWAYGSKGTALQGKTLSISISLGASESDYSASGEMKHSIKELLLPFELTAHYTGMHYANPFITGGALTITDEQLSDSVARYRTWLTE
ncbi:NAD(P)H-dependent oxidoreductase [Ursidibacter sp. B-7004-1]